MVERASFTANLPTAAASPPRNPDTSALRAARRARAAHQLRFESGDQEVIHLPAGAAMDLIRSLASGASSSVQQIVPLPFLPSPGTFPTADVSRAPMLRNADDFAHVVSCNLAELGRQVERVYLLPPGHARAEAVERKLHADNDQKIHSRCLLTSNIEPALAHRTPLSQMWIFDERAVLFQEAMAEGPPVWTVSVRDHDLSAARQLWRALWNRGERFQARDFDLIDPLLISADSLAAAAPLSCRPTSGSRTGCDWYHGAWQYLRLFDMVPSPGLHAPFYRSTFAKRLSAVPRPRVLITGTADYSLPAHVFNAWMRVHRDSDLLPALHVDVMDRCPTPLNACRWYAAAINQSVQTYEMDARDRLADCVKTESYDLIAADDLLTHVDGDDCAAVLENWSELLADDGVVVTTVRVVPEDHSRAGVLDAIADFSTRAKHSARRWRTFLQAGVEDVSDAARRYAERISSVNHGKPADIKNMFEKAGLRVLHTETKEFAGELTHSTYLRVVAAKMGEAVGTPSD
jgi:hypothetical protein